MMHHLYPLRWLALILPDVADPPGLISKLDTQELEVFI